MTREEEIEALVAWMEEARKRAVEALKNANLPTMVDAPSYRIVPTENGGERSESVAATRNILADSSQRDKLYEAMAFQGFQVLGGVAQSFLTRTNVVVEELRRSLPVSFAPLLRKDVKPAEDVMGWLVHVYFGGILDYYLESLEDVGRPDIPYLREILEEAFVVFEQRKWRLDFSVPVRGVQGECKTVCGGLALRPTTGFEKADFVSQRLGGPGGPFSGFPTHVIVIRDTWTLETAGISYETPVRMMLAFCLMGLSSVQCDWGWSMAMGPRWLRTVGVSGPMTLESNKLFHADDVGQKMLEEVLELERLMRPHYQDKSGPEFISCDRFLRAMGRGNKVDSLIDFVVALEATLLPGMDKGELSFRFQLNGANFLGGTPEDKAKTAGALKKAYDIRSRIVHGGKSVSSEDLKAAVDDAQELARRILLKCVQEGWPSADDFKALYFH